MNRSFVTVSYLLAHLAAAAVGMSIIVVVPFVAMVVLAVVSDDPGGPLFFPAFLLVLVAVALAAVGVLSVATAVSDFARSRWRVLLWVPPCIVLCAVGIPVAGSGAIANGLLVGFGAAVAFSLYWLAVSSIWFLPRLLARLFRVRFGAFTIKS